MRLASRERRKFNGDISKWKTSSVTTMAYMFYEAYAFNQPIGGWDTSNVASMRAMFLSASAFNQDIGKWDTSKVTNMRAMFYEVPAFNRDVRRWHTVQVTDMSWMFYHANAFNSDISHWVTRHRDCISEHVRRIDIVSGQVRVYGRRSRPVEIVRVYRVYSRCEMARFSSKHVYQKKARKSPANALHGHWGILTGLRIGT